MSSQPRWADLAAEDGDISEGVYGADVDWAALGGAPAEPDVAAGAAEGVEVLRGGDAACAADGGRSGDEGGGSIYAGSGGWGPGFSNVGDLGSSDPGDLGIGASSGDGLSAKAWAGAAWQAPARPWRPRARQGGRDLISGPRHFTDYDGVEDAVSFDELDPGPVGSEGADSVDERSEGDSGCLSCINDFNGFDGSSIGGDDVDSCPDACNSDNQVTFTRKAWKKLARKIRSLELDGNHDAVEPLVRAWCLAHAVNGR